MNSMNEWTIYFVSCTISEQIKRIHDERTQCVLFVCFWFLLLLNITGVRRLCGFFIVFIGSAIEIQLERSLNYLQN